jgi:hypothetical protein
LFHGLCVVLLQLLKVVCVLDSLVKNSLGIFIGFRCHIMVTGSIAS